MRLKLITTTSNLKNCERLKNSLDKYGWDYHIIEHEWDGFLGKLHYSYKYLRSLKDYTHFIYTDAWDSICFGGMEEAKEKVPDNFLLSAERACYPHGEKAALYPFNISPWHFVNGGGWAGSIESFLKLYESVRPSGELNDQVYFTDRYLEFRHNINLDYECKIFQTIAFCPESDFEITERVRNTFTNQYPLFVHGNGHTPLDRFI